MPRSIKQKHSEWQHAQVYVCHNRTKAIIIGNKTRWGCGKCGRQPQSPPRSAIGDSCAKVTNKLSTRSRISAATVFTHPYLDMGGWNRAEKFRFVLEGLAFRLVDKSIVIPISKDISRNEAANRRNISVTSMASRMLVFTTFRRLYARKADSRGTGWLLYYWRSEYPRSVCWSSKIRAFKIHVRLELITSFRRSSPCSVEYDRAIQYPYFFSTFPKRILYRSLFLVYWTTDLKTTPGNSFDWEYAGDTVQLINGAQANQHTLDGLEIEVFMPSIFFGPSGYKVFLKLCADWLNTINGFKYLVILATTDGDGTEEIMSRIEKATAQPSRVRVAMKSGYPSKEGCTISQFA